MFCIPNDFTWYRTRKKNKATKLGVLVQEIAMYICVALDADAICDKLQKSPHDRCLICENPPIMGKNWVFGRKMPIIVFFTLSESKICKKVPIISAGMLKLLPFIGATFFKPTHLYRYLKYGSTLLQAFY